MGRDGRDEKNSIFRFSIFRFSASQSPFDLEIAMDSSWEGGVLAAVGG
jgi:hypothetical protein